MIKLKRFSKGTSDMKFNFFLIAISFLFILPQTGCQPKITKKSFQSFIILSDIHFDPLSNKDLFNELVAFDISKWDSIFATSKKKKLEPRADANWHLFQSTLNDLKARVFNPEFLIITGDLLVHKMQKLFNENISDKIRLQLTTKTIDYIYLKLEEYFPSIPIYSALGNNDNFKGNYGLEPSGQFLKNISNTWFNTLRSKVDSAMFMQTFRLGGYYSSTPSPGHKLISLNTVLFSQDYPDFYDSAPIQQLNWLQRELQCAKEKEEKVWLIYHIPPGVDAYATIDNNRNKTSFEAQLHWKPKYNKQFVQLIIKYQNIVRIQFGGHTHKDSFSVVVDSVRNPVSVIHTTPSISMYNGNNPAYHHVSFDSDFEILGFDAFHLNNPELIEQSAWKKAYSFDGTYQLDEYSPRSLSKILSEMMSYESPQSCYLSSYIYNYNSGSVNHSNDKDLNWKSEDKNWPEYGCAMTFQLAERYEDCVAKMREKR